MLYEVNNFFSKEVAEEYTKRGIRYVQARGYGEKVVVEPATICFEQMSTEYCTSYVNSFIPLIKAVKRNGDTTRVVFKVGDKQKTIRVSKMHEDKENFLVALCYACQKYGPFMDKTFQK